MRRGATIVTMLVALLVGMSPAAMATGGVVEKDSLTDSFGPEVDHFLSYMCGVEVSVEGSFSVRLTFYEDTSLKVRVIEKITFSSEAGQVDLRHVASIHFEPEEFVDNGDGTGTILIPHRELGNFQLRSAGQAPIAMDAGWIDWLIELTIDLETGEVVDGHEVVLDTRGPHPILEAAFDEFIGYLCTGLTG